MRRPPPRSTLFPYTTLFRSGPVVRGELLELHRGLTPQAREGRGPAAQDQVPAPDAVLTAIGSVRLQQRPQVRERDIARGRVARLEDPGEKRALPLLEREHPFLDRLRADQLVARDDPRLPDPVRAVRRLRLGRGIPPWVKMDDRVRPGEVEPGPSGLEGEKEDGRVGRRLEAVDLLLPRRRRHGAVEVAVGDSL